MTHLHSDALVVFGVTGDLAHKMIFPALYALVKSGALKAPVVGVARSDWTSTQLRERVADSLKRSGGVDDPDALERLMSLLAYVSGDYNKPATFAAIKQALGGAARPALLSGDPAWGVRDSHQRARRRRPRRRRARHRREAVRPRSRISAIALNRVARRVFPEDSIFRIDHYPRQGSDHEHPLFPLRQFVPRADLEPQLHRQRAGDARRRASTSPGAAPFTRRRAACAT